MAYIVVRDFIDRGKKPPKQYKKGDIWPGPGIVHNMKWKNHVIGFRDDAGNPVVEKINNSEESKIVQAQIEVEEKPYEPSYMPPVPDLEEDEIIEISDEKPNNVENVDPDAMPNKDLAQRPNEDDQTYLKRLQTIAGYHKIRGYALMKNPETLISRIVNVRQNT